MTSTCHQCRSIIEQLQLENRGQEARCPVCRRRYVRGRHWVLDEEGSPVNERWQVSARPAYCSSCGWSGAMRDVAFLEGDCFPIRCPLCGGIVANRKGEE